MRIWREIPCATVGFLSLGLSSCASMGPPRNVGADLSFEDRISQYSEDALLEEVLTTEGGTVLVGTKSCPQDLRDRLNQLVPVSSERAAASISRNAPFGLPVEAPENANEVYLYQDEYVLRYNTSLKLPVFSSYLLRRQDIVKGERVECFREDPRIGDGGRSRLIDYDGDTGFDRGHLAPDADMQRSADTAMNTYFLTNMMPQHGSVNSGSWKYLEDATRLWAAELGEVLVVSGPIFDQDNDAHRDDDSDAVGAPPTRKVALPTAFFKIVVDMSDPDEPRAIAFILPHTRRSTAPNPPYVLTKFVSIDEIEQTTGFDLFPELDDQTEAAMEASKETDLWCRRRCN